MPEFLSESWLRALDRALRPVAAATSGATFVVEQVVRDVPRRGDVRYRLVVDADGARVDGSEPDAALTADTPAVRLTTDYATAVAIATGHENAQHALAAGRLRVGGDVDVLLRNGEVLVALSDVTAALRSDTTFPSP